MVPVVVGQEQVDADGGHRGLEVVAQQADAGAPSMTMRLPEASTTSRQVVLPPNSRVVGPGEGMEPLVPQNRISITCLL